MTALENKLRENVLKQLTQELDADAVVNPEVVKVLGDLYLGMKRIEFDEKVIKDATPKPPPNVN